MKKTLIAIASIAAMGAASAGPTVYGLIDVGVASTSGGGAASQTAIGDGSYSSNRFGVKGDMDLGSGLKGIYQYETGVKASKPGAISWGDRGAYAGVSGGFGTVTVGRNFTPYAISLFNDAMEYDNLSAYWSVNDAIGIHGDNVWKSNAITYTTPSFNGLTINAMVSPGGDASNAKAASTSTVPGIVDGAVVAVTTITPAVPASGASSYTGLGATYGLGALNLTVGWESNKVGSSDVTTTASNVGAAYGFGVATVSAAFQKADNGTNQDSGWTVNAAIPLTGKYALQVGYATMTTNTTVNVPNDFNPAPGTNPVGGATLTSTNIVVVNDLTPAARLYAGVVSGTSTKAANSNAVKAGIRYSF